MKKRHLSFAVAVAISLLVVSCGKDDNPMSPSPASPPPMSPPPTPTPPPPAPPPPSNDITLGGTKVDKVLFAKVLKSQALAASYNRTEGATAGERIAPLILGMALDDLDFGALSNLSFSFDHGVYEATYGRDHLRCVFYYVENFDAFNAGDTILSNLFAIDSYVQNVVITWHGISYDEGPLFHLINGSIRFDGLKPVVSIGADKLLFSMEYNGVAHIRQPDGFTDTLYAFVRTAPANVEVIANGLANGGYTLIFDSTRYLSRYYGVDGTIEASRFNVRKQGEDYWVDGEVSGRITQNGLTFYFSGEYSNHGGNVTDFYLTPERSVSVGTSRLENDLRSGVFMSAERDTLSFQLP